MTIVLAICVAVTMAVSIYMILGRDLKALAMGVFLLGHTANLSIIAMSGSPVILPASGSVHADAGADVAWENHLGMSEVVRPVADTDDPPEHGHPLGEFEEDKPAIEIKEAPVLEGHGQMPEDALAELVDPLPQALILTAIVIGFAVMGFLLSLIVVTARQTETLSIDQLAQEQLATPSEI